MSLYARITNRMLHDLEHAEQFPCRLPTEERLALHYGVSRATIRRALAHLSNRGIAHIAGHTKKALRPPQKSDYFPIDENEAAPRERVLDHLVDRLCRAREEDLSFLTETELARELGCNRQVIREELARISYYGLVVKHPHRGWKITEFTEALLMEIFEVRELFEMHAMKKVLTAPDEHPIWRELAHIRAEMAALDRNRQQCLNRAVKLDEQFHDALRRHCQNRYMARFNNMCHILIEYNLRRREVSTDRILIGLDDHLIILDALLARNEEAALAALRVHFGHAQALIKADAQDIARDESV